MKIVSAVYWRPGLILVLSLFTLVGCQTASMNQDAKHFILPDTIPETTSQPLNLVDNATVDHILEATLEASEPRFSLHLLDEPVESVLQQLAWQAEKELEIWPHQASSITLRAEHQTLDEILHQIATASGLQVLLYPDLIIARPDQLYWHSHSLDILNLQRTKVDDLVTNLNIGQISLSAASQNSSQSKMQVVSESNVWSSVKGNLAQLLVNEPIATDIPDVERVVVQPEAGLVMVLASYQQQRFIKDWLNHLQRRTKRQVLIEAVIAEVILSEEFETGINWSLDGLVNQARSESPTNERVFSASLGVAGLDVMLGLRWLENFGQVSVLSSPRIMALNNQPAILKVVDNFIYFTIGVVRTTNQTITEVSYGSNLNSVPVGLILNVLPMITEDQQVMLNVRPSVTRIIGQVRDPNPDLAAVGIENFVPLIQEREMETLLKMQHNETVIIGGLIEQRQDLNQTGIRGLSRQPGFLGRLFGLTRSGQAKSELVVLLRAQIIEDES